MARKRSVEDVQENNNQPAPKQKKQGRSRVYHLGRGELLHAYEEQLAKQGTNVYDFATIPTKIDDPLSISPLLSVLPTTAHLLRAMNNSEPSLVTAQEEQISTENTNNHSADMYDPFLAELNPDLLREIQGFNSYQEEPVLLSPTLCEAAKAGELVFQAPSFVGQSIWSALNFSSELDDLIEDYAPPSLGATS